jgi:methylenetetrahydrofolate dehydrogenase (NADP+)/methenyltetrahydrofolate cyclohydrolase
MGQVLDGNRIRDQIKEECRPRIDAFRNRAGRPPGLSVVLVGDNPASQVYVRSKTRTAADLGMFSETITPAATITTAELLALIDALNVREDVDGILVQLPLPAHIDAQRILLAVDPRKDVDGFHPLNSGNLMAGRPAPRPCTPAGIIEMLKRYRIAIAGTRAVVIGRSDIVGKPMALLLLQENATVTICHSKTRDLPAVCRQADLLVAAIGRAAMVTADFIREGATVIDVGMNRIEARADVERYFPGSSAKLAAFEKSGSLLIGDVDPVAMAERAGAWTPVPGGVGPLTIAMLMANTITCAELNRAC